MERYNYFEAVKEDVRSWLKHDADDFKNEHADENGVWLTEDNIDDISGELNDLLWCNDGITGNGSGSYTFNTWQAEENLCHNLDELQEALREFGCGIEYLEKGADACDVTLRCYYLAPAITAVLNEMLER